MVYTAVGILDVLGSINRTFREDSWEFVCNWM